eukprot:3203668-Rhodomonas_salina.5
MDFESLKVNQALMAEIESLLLASGKLQLSCEGCSNNAQTHCNNCNVLLCQSCEEDHSKYKPFINHKLTPTTEMRVLPKARQTCTKHKTKELRLFCSTCQALICDDCPIKDHKDHNYDLLEQMAGDQRTQLAEQAALVEQAIIPLQQGIQAIKQEEATLAQSREATKKSIQESYDALARTVEQRCEEVKDKVDEVYRKKQKILEGQWKGVGLVVASMQSASRHVRHVADICNDQQVAEGFGQTTTRLQALRERPFDLSPDTSGRIGFAWPKGETSAWLMECIAKKGRVTAHEVDVSRCVAEGEGLEKATPGKTSTFTVQLKDHLGQACVADGEIVEAREVASDAEPVRAASAEDIRVQDISDGICEVSYVARGPGVLQLEVLIDGCPVPGSPFSIHVAGV